MSRVVWDTVNSDASLLYSNGNQTAIGNHVTVAQKAFASKAVFKDVTYWETETTDGDGPNTVVGILDKQEAGSLLGVTGQSVGITIDATSFVVTLNGVSIYSYTGHPATAFVGRIRHLLDVSNRLYKIAFEDDPDVWYDIINGQTNFNNTSVWIPAAQLLTSNNEGATPDTCTIYGQQTGCLFSLPAGAIYLLDSPYNYSSNGLNISDVDFEDFLQSEGEDKVLLVEADYVTGVPSGEGIITDDSNVVISPDKFNVYVNDDGVGKAYSEVSILEGERKYFEVRINETVEYDPEDPSKVFIGLLIGKDISTQLSVGDHIDGSIGLSPEGATQINNVLTICQQSIGINFSIDAVLFSKPANFIGTSEGTFSIDAIITGGSTDEESPEGCAKSPFSSTGIQLKPTGDNTYGVSIDTNANGDIAVVGNDNTKNDGATIWKKVQASGAWQLSQTLTHFGEVAKLSPSGQYLLLAEDNLVYCYMSSGVIFVLQGSYVASANIIDAAIMDDGTAFVVRNSSTEIVKLTAWS